MAQDPIHSPVPEYLRLSPEELAEELAGRGRVAWLVGAGLSRPAGLPLSRELWQLLAIAWLRGRREPLYPAEGDGTAPMVAALQQLLGGPRLLPLPLAGPLADGDGERARLREELLLALAELRDRARRPEEAEALQPPGDHDATYRTVLHLTAPAPEARRRLLQGLLQGRPARPGLAHLLLAALLDGGRMATVFTVGFDDLLLQALLLLNKPARVLDDRDRRERPLLSYVPGVPQVVHLHGRPASYQVGPEPVGVLLDQLRDASLVVCGYRGADERIMAALRHWLKDEEATGTLYWVLHREEQAQALFRWPHLCGAPPDRVRLVSRQRAPLPAEDLLIRLCATLLPAQVRVTGDRVADLFADLIRRGAPTPALLHLGRAFPEHDPVALLLRRRHEGRGERARAGPLAMAEELAGAAAVPEWRHQVLLARMHDHLARGHLSDAYLCAEEVRQAAQRLPAGEETLLRLRAQGLCGELALHLGHTELARRHLLALCRDEGCPDEWREEARHLLLMALLGEARAEGPAVVLPEIRALLELPIRAPASAARCLIVEAELYALSGDRRRALLVYESADELARQQLGAVALASLSGLPEGLVFSPPAPSEAEREASALQASRQARFGLLVHRLDARLEAQTDDPAAPALLREVARFTEQFPLSDWEGRYMAAELYARCAQLDRSFLSAAAAHAEAARRLCGERPWAGPGPACRVLRTAAQVAHLSGQPEEAERLATLALQQARRARAWDEEGHLELLRAQLALLRARRPAADPAQRAEALRRAAAHAEVAWLRASELSLAPLRRAADELLSSLRAVPAESLADMTPVP
jgi:hypothetical protein